MAMIVHCHGPYRPLWLFLAPEGSPSILGTSFGVRVLTFTLRLRVPASLVPGSDIYPNRTRTRLRGISVTEGRYGRQHNLCYASELRVKVYTFYHCIPAAYGIAQHDSRSSKMILTRRLTNIYVDGKFLTSSASTKVIGLSLRELQAIVNLPKQVRGKKAGHGEARIFIDTPCHQDKSANSGPKPSTKKTRRPYGFGNCSTWLVLAPLMLLELWLSQAAYGALPQAPYSRSSVPSTPSCTTTVTKTITPIHTPTQTPIAMPILNNPNITASQRIHEK